MRSCSGTCTDSPGPDELKKAYDDLNDRYMRLAADFENYQRRTTRERESVVASGKRAFALESSEVVDNLDRALNSDEAHLREGLQQIRSLFGARLERNGIVPIDSLKRPFNPAEHEAIAHVPSDEPEGMVIDEVTRGYRMHERVIRHAKVAVSKGKLQ
jgi:molecular chaperone GrpE